MEQPWISCEFKSWGRGKITEPNSLLLALLDDIFTSLSKQISTSAIQRLPQQMVTALQGHSMTKWTVPLLGGEPNIEELIEKWLMIMAASNSRMWILLEDLDRRTSHIDDTNALMPFIDQVARHRYADHIRFIFTLDDSRTHLSSSLRIPYFRIDLIYTDQSRQYIKKVVNSFIGCIENQLMKNYRYCLSNKKNVLGAPIVHNRNVHGLYMLEMCKESEEALYNLLSSPRVIKIILREVGDLLLDASAPLYGEVVAEDLLLLTTLKYQAPAVFNLITNKKYKEDIIDKIKTGVKNKDNKPVFPYRDCISQLPDSIIDIKSSNSIDGLIIAAYLLCDWDILAVASHEHPLNKHHNIRCHLFPDYFIPLMISGRASNNIDLHQWNMKELQKFLKNHAKPYGSDKFNIVRRIFNTTLFHNKKISETLKPLLPSLMLYHFNFGETFEDTDKIWLLFECYRSLAVGQCINNKYLNDDYQKWNEMNYIFNIIDDLKNEDKITFNHIDEECFLDVFIDHYHDLQELLGVELFNLESDVVGDVYFNYLKEKNIFNSILNEQIFYHKVTDESQKKYKKFIREHKVIFEKKLPIENNDEHQKEKNYKYLYEKYHFLDNLNNASYEEIILYNFGRILYPEYSKTQCS